LKPDPISDEIKSFIFACVDSVSLLETLLLLFADPAKSWTVKSLATELRGSSASSERALEKLKKFGLVEEAPHGFQYASGDSLRDSMLRALVEAYRVQRHTVLGLVFSPMKKARDFADSFRIKGENEGEGDA
jgi:hypothetical protein